VSGYMVHDDPASRCERGRGDEGPSPHARDSLYPGMEAEFIMHVMLMFRMSLQLVSPRTTRTCVPRSNGKNSSQDTSVSPMFLTKTRLDSTDVSEP
jgi:hypothetical protein